MYNDILHYYINIVLLLILFVKIYLSLIKPVVMFADSVGVQTFRGKFKIIFKWSRELRRLDGTNQSRERVYAAHTVVGGG